MVLSRILSSTFFILGSSFQRKERIFPMKNARGLGSQLKDSIPVTELSASGPFESHDLLRKGFSCVKNELLPSHPLELSEKNFQLNQDKMNFSTLRNIQGLFAPLKLQMEFKAVQQVQRLPFLPSSNLSLDILRGNDETIGFEDILNGSRRAGDFVLFTPGPPKVPGSC
uniref:Proteasome maturation protein n=1 Tax=Bos mutus grunniens TaxID=30521 RepID=A0A8B9WQ66_BOSMU